MGGGGGGGASSNVAASWRRLVFCQNLGGEGPPLVTPLSYVLYVLRLKICSMNDSLVVVFKGNICSHTALSMFQIFCHSGYSIAFTKIKKKIL